jgi:uncharacterized protein YifE (UPF0438 family)
MRDLTPEEEARIKAHAVKMCGDNKLPNRFWVSAHADYLTNKANYRSKQSNCYDWAGDTYKDLPEKYRMLGEFRKFEDALKCANEFLESGGVPSPEDTWDDFHSIQIEDRLTGTLWEAVWSECHRRFGDKKRFHKVSFDFEYNDDTKYTRETMQERGFEFI